MRAVPGMSYRRPAFRARVRACLIAVAASACTSAPRAITTETRGLHIRNVNIVDVQTGRILPQQSVIISGNRIHYAGAASGAPAGSWRIVNGDGGYIIPGLWDMHVHNFNNRTDGANLSAAFFPAEIANGVTGVRDMFTDLDDLKIVARWASELSAGRRLGPRVVGSSTIVDGTPAIWPNVISVANAAAARRAVDSLVDGGAQFIKVYSRLSREAYFAIAEQSKLRHIAFAGHVPPGVTHAEASDAGQRTFEHFYDVLTNCSADVRAENQRLARMAADTAIRLDSSRAITRSRRRMLLTRFDVAECTPLFAKLKANDTWQSPTLSVKTWIFRHVDSASRSDERLKYLPASVTNEWKELNFPGVDSNPETIELLRALFRLEQRALAAMHAAGVPFIAGTDLHNPYIYPGFSLHDELALLVEAGLTPLEALRTATLNPARFLNATDSLGTVATGKLADLVLLRLNPLDDIHNTTSISAVVMNGRYLDRKSLDELLVEAKRAAGHL